MTTVDYQLAGHLIDPSEYDLEGHPKLDGRKAQTLPVGFDSFELDHTDAQHMKLAGRLEEGGYITLTVTAYVARRSWTQRLDGDKDTLSRFYRIHIEDITA